MRNLGSKSVKNWEKRNSDAILAGHMELRKDFEKRICTCKRDFLENDYHFLECPVLQLQKIANELNKKI